MSSDLSIPREGAAGDDPILSFASVLGWASGSDLVFHLSPEQAGELLAEQLDAAAERFGREMALRGIGCDDVAQIAQQMARRALGRGQSFVDVETMMARIEAHCRRGHAAAPARLLGPDGETGSTESRIA